ncbi:hypothetical protein THAOC_31645, partial [Thalassiosira oceanica]
LLGEPGASAGGPVVDGDPWAKQVGINALAADLLNLENIMDVVDQAIYPETREDKARKAAEKARKESADAREEEERAAAAKKAADDEAMVASQLVRADSNADQSLEGRGGNWLTRALCCGPACGGSNSYGTSSTTMESTIATADYTAGSTVQDTVNTSGDDPTAASKDCSTLKTVEEQTSHKSRDASHKSRDASQRSPRGSTASSRPKADRYAGHIGGRAGWRLDRRVDHRVDGPELAEEGRPGRVRVGLVEEVLHPEQDVRVVGRLTRDGPAGGEQAERRLEPDQGRREGGGAGHGEQHRRLRADEADGEAAADRHGPAAEQEPTAPLEHEREGRRRRRRPAAATAAADRAAAAADTATATAVRAAAASATAAPATAAPATTTAAAAAAAAAGRILRPKRCAGEQQRRQRDGEQQPRQRDGEQKRRRRRRRRSPAIHQPQEILPPPLRGWDAEPHQPVRVGAGLAPRRQRPQRQRPRRQRPRRQRARCQRPRRVREQRPKRRAECRGDPSGEMVTDTAPRGRPLRGVAPILSSPTSQSATLNDYGSKGYAPPQYQQQPRQVNMQQVYQQTNPSSNASYGNSTMAGPGNYSHPSQEYTAYGSLPPENQNLSGYRSAKSPAGDMNQPWQQSASLQSSPKSMPPRDPFSISKMNSNLSVESDYEDRADRYGAVDLGQTEEERDQPPVHYSYDENPTKSPAIAMLMTNDSAVDEKDRYGGMPSGLNSMKSQQRRQGGYPSQAQEQLSSSRNEARQQQGAYGGQNQQHQQTDIAARSNEATNTNPAMMSGNAQQSPQQPSGYGMPRRAGVQNHFNYGSVGTMPPLPEQQQIDMSHWQMNPDEGAPRPNDGEYHNQQEVDMSHGQMQPEGSPRANNGAHHSQAGGPGPVGYYGQNSMAPQQQEQQHQPPPQGMMQPAMNGPYPNHGVGVGYNNTSPPRRSFLA